MAFSRVSIPSNQAFLKQWHAWIHGKVSRNFKRNKERVLDSVQNVRLRLLQKDFIGRWFYKHLKDQFVDRTQAELMLGGLSIQFNGKLKPVSGNRLSPDSIWSISDILAYAKFDYERYFYSIQNHTLDSNRILKLLGYNEGSYNSLASLYRQGRLLPAPLTEHDCARRGVVGSKPKDCNACIVGLAYLKERSLSLASDWMNPKVASQISKLRWNDRQLKPFLRSWKNQNMIKCTPQYIMREPGPDGEVLGIDAGLLKYAERVIHNAVVNDFKELGVNDDLNMAVLNNGLSPEGEGSLAFDGDFEDSKQKVVRDNEWNNNYNSVESMKDLRQLLESTDLTEEEKSVIYSTDLDEMSIRDFSNKTRQSIQKVHRIRNSAIRKLREAVI